MVVSELVRLTSRPSPGAGESRKTLPVVWKPAPVVDVETLEMPGPVTVTVLDRAVVAPAAVARIWYWPVAEGRSAVTWFAA